MVVQNTRILQYAKHLTTLEIWIVCGIVGASLVYTQLLPISVVIIILFWFIRWISNGYLMLRTPADLPILFLLLLLAVTYWVTPLPHTTRTQVYRLISGIGLYYTIVNWGNSNSRIKLLIAGIAALSVALSILGLFSVQWSTVKKPFIPNSIYDYLPTLVTDVIHRNVMGGYLVFLLPCLLGILLFAWSNLSKLEQLALLFAFLITNGVIILTQSRGAWLAYGIIVLMVSMIRWKWGWVGSIIIVIFIIVTINSFGVDTVLDIIVTDETITSIELRVEIWHRALYIIHDFPFTGAGMGTFGEIANVFYPFFLAAPVIVPHAHNLFLQVAVDMGIPGLIAWLAILILIILVAWKVYKQGQYLSDNWVTGLGAGLLASQTALTVHGMTDAVTWGMVRPAPIVWAIWGLAVAAWHVYGINSYEEHV